MSTAKRVRFLTWLGLAAAIGLLGALSARPLRAAQSARTYYVSPGGNNGDGLSWAAAWRDLDEIRWSVVQPGDTIMLDGGPSSCPPIGTGPACGIVYASTLDVQASGQSGAPITIRLSGERGRNGTAIIDGGLTQWSRCSSYAPEVGPPAVGGALRPLGILIDNEQWIVIDGTRWGGIEVRNHTRLGVDLGDSQHVLVRYLKIHHNTDPNDTTNGAVGVAQGYLAGYNTLARSEIFRNGQDAIRSAGDYFTIEENYIHDQYCNHPDGIQAFVPTARPEIADDAGEMRGLVIRRNIFQRIGLQAIFLGEPLAGHDSWAVDVTIEHNLFIDDRYMVKSNHARTTNWLVRHNTFYGAAQLAVEWCCVSPGAQAPMVIADNIFANIGREESYAAVLNSGGGPTTVSNNCLYRSGRLAGTIDEIGTIRADPGFANAALGDLAPSSGSACGAMGASITSLASLLAQTGAGQVLPRGAFNAFLPTVGQR